MHSNKLVSATSKLSNYHPNSWAARGRTVTSVIPLAEIQNSEKRAVSNSSETKSLQTSLR